MDTCAPTNLFSLAEYVDDRLLGDLGFATGLLLRDLARSSIFSVCSILAVFLVAAGFFFLTVLGFVVFLF